MTTTLLTTSLAAVIEENFKLRGEITTLKAERDQWKMEAIRLRGAIANASAIIGGL